MYPWNGEPPLLINLALQLGAYLACTIGPLRRYFPGSKPATALEIQLFALGWLTLFVALVSPVDTLGGYSLTMHMVQHILVTLVAPPLMLLGTPRWLLRPILRVPLALPIGRFLTHPIAAFVIFNSVFLAWHVPALYDLALREEPVHILEHVMFFAAGVLAWWPVCSPLDELPRAHPLVQTAFLFFQSLPSTILGAIIAFAAEPLYPHYTTVPQLWGLSVMEDQQLAGLIMWVPASLVYFGALSVVFIRWLNRNDRESASQHQTAP
nr:MAG: cytochrome c oxidase assembly protein [Chloroflexota bacterium]